MGACRELAGSWPAAARELAGSWPGAGRELAGSWAGAGRQLAGIWPGAGRGLAGSCLAPGRQLAGIWEDSGESFGGALEWLWTGLAYHRRIDKVTFVDICDRRSVRNYHRRIDKVTFVERYNNNGAGFERYGALPGVTLPGVTLRGPVLSVIVIMEPVSSVMGRYRGTLCRRLNNQAKKKGKKHPKKMVKQLREHLFKGCQVKLL